MTWLTGWTRRKIKIVENLTVSDYQMKLIIHKSGLGPDTSTDIYLGGHCRDDFADLRFTGPDQTTLLSYWIESITGTTPNLVATVWIKIPTLTPTNNIYIYYDNPIASPVSSGTNTFDFFDDFEDGIYTDKWDQLSKNTYSLLAETGGYLRLGSTDTGGISTSSGASVRNKTPSIGDGAAYIFKVVFNPSEGWEEYYFDFNGTGTWNRPYCGSEAIYGANDGYELYLHPTALYLYKLNNNSTRTEVGLHTGLSMSSVYIKITYLTPNIKVFTSPDNVNWTEQISWTGATTKTGNIIIFDRGCGDRYGSINYHEIKVFKHASPGPTFGVSGSEELNITATLMNLNTNTCTGPCQIIAGVTWQNLGSSSITFTPAVLIDNTILAYGTDITIPAGGTNSATITTLTLPIGSHTICPYPN